MKAELKAARPTITCAWCRKAIDAGRHARLARARSFGASAATQAYFHVRCSEAIIGLCDDRHLSPASAKPSAMIDAAVEKAAEQCAVHRVTMAAPPATPPVPKPARRALPTRPVSKPAPNPLATGGLADDARQKIRELAGRGFKPQMISAQLRLPYAAVAAALEGAR